MAIVEKVREEDIVKEARKVLRACGNNPTAAVRRLSDEGCGVELACEVIEKAAQHVSKSDIIAVERYLASHENDIQATVDYYVHRRNWPREKATSVIVAIINRVGTVAFQQQTRSEASLMQS